MKESRIDPRAFVAPGAAVYGDVTVKKDAGIWFHAVVRGERDSVTIGEGSNVQDNCVVHVDEGFGVKIGDYVSIGHGAVIHGCTIGDNTLIGMGAVILNGARIGKNCIIGAGALVTQNTVIPDGFLAVGSPAKVKRQVTPEEIEANRENALLYIREAKEYREYLEAGKR